jgi:hypothetical protein
LQRNSFSDFISHLLERESSFCPYFYPLLSLAQAHDLWISAILSTGRGDIRTVDEREPRGNQAANGRIG